MNLNKVITVAGVVLTVTLPFWYLVPGISYLLEIIVMLAMFVLAIDRSRWLVIGVAGAALIVGTFPGLATMPTSLFLPLLFKAVAPAFLLGMLINRGYKAGLSFAAASLLMAFLVMVMYLQATGAIAEEVDKLSAAVGGMLTAPMKGQGYSTEMINDMAHRVTQFFQLLKRLLPGMMVLSGMGQLFVAAVVADWYVTRRDGFFPGFGPFAFWKIPEKLLYLLGVALVVRLTLDGTPQVIADNTLLILAFLYAVCGLALIEHILRRLRLPLFIKIIFYLGLLLMQLPGLIVTAVAGLFDSYFDFRKVRAHTLG